MEQEELWEELAAAFIAIRDQLLPDPDFPARLPLQEVLNGIVLTEAMLPVLQEAPFEVQQLGQHAVALLEKLKHDPRVRRGSEAGEEELPEWTT